MKQSQPGHGTNLRNCATTTFNHGQGRSFVYALLAAGAAALLCLAPTITRGSAIGSPVGWGTYFDEFYEPAATNVVPANLTNLTAIAGGFAFSVGLTTNGTVIVWGESSQGETNVPASVTNAVAIAAGWYNGLALISGGTVVGWGENNDGQTNIPASVTNAVAIGSGATHSLAVLPNGTVVAWGSDYDGETNVPASVTNAVAIAAGSYHSLALLSNGSVVAWGDDGNGETNVPANVTNAVAIGAGYYDSFAVLANGSVVGWGYDSFNQTNVPASVTNAVAVVGGYGYGLALVGTNITSNTPSDQPPTISCPNTARISCTETNGTAADVTVAVTDTNGNAVQVIWYVNQVAYQTNSVFGGSGGTSTNVTLSADFSETGPYTIFVSASDGITSAVSCVTEVNIDSASDLVSWGDDSYGQTNVPASVTNAVAIAAGTYHGLAVLPNGSVVGWGDDSHGEINVPGSVTNAVAVAGGLDFSLALLANGSVVGWGYDSFGEINVPGSVTNAVAIAAGAYHGLAVLANGSVAAWGYNGYGQINVPASATNAVAVAAGFDHSLALLANGSVVGWGYNEDGQTNVPASVTNAVAIAAGYDFSLAVLASGSVVGWGNNGQGETNVPASVTNALAVAAGYEHGLALLANDSVVAWGYDTNGTTSVPAGLTGVPAIAAGGYFSLALESLQISLIGPASTNVECHSTYTDPGATATGLCGVNLNSSITTNGSVDTTTLGNYQISYTVVEGAGQSTVIRAINVVDTTPPVPDMSSLPDMVAQCSTNVTTIPTATDACSGSVSGTTTGATSFATQGTNYIYWTYTDTSSNSTVQTQRVIIADTTAPVPNVSSLPDVVAQCSTNVTTAPTATDNCAGTITGTTGDPTTFNSQGTNYIHWTYSDGHGNSTIQTQRVIIADTIAPVPNVSSLPDIVAQCSTNVTTAPTATDNCAGLVTGTTTGETSFATQGTNFIYWTYGDGHGNSTIQTQRVIIADTIAPVPNVSSLPDIVAQCSTNVTTAPTATDACAGLVTGTTSNSTSLNTQGTNYIYWTYSDGHGNSTIQTQRVIIADTIAPVPNVSSLPDIVAQCSTNVTTAPTATDNCVGTVTGTTGDPTTFNTQGTNFIHWTYSDGHGNSTIQTQRVIIADTIAPVPNVGPLPDIVAQCSTNVTTAPTATDNCVGTVTGTTGDPTTFSSQGTNFIHWTYSDGHGNSTIQTQRVIIAETTAPSIECPTNITVNATNAAGVAVTFATPSAGNPCSDANVACVPPSGSVFAVGTNTVTCTASDGHGHQTQCTFSVIVRGALDQTVVAFDELAALDAGITNNSHFAKVDLKDLGAALSELTNSANGVFWSNDNQPLTNATVQVFRQDLKALGKLLADVRDKHSTVNKTNLESVVNELVAACRLTAVVAITDAQTNGVAAKLITEANELVAKGDVALTPSAALRKYTAAWKKVQPKKG